MLAMAVVGDRLVAVKDNNDDVRYMEGVSETNVAQMEAGSVDRILQMILWEQAFLLLQLADNNSSQPTYNCLTVLKEQGVLIVQGKVGARGPRTGLIGNIIRYDTNSVTDRHTKKK